MSSSSTSSSKQAMASTIQPLKLCKNSDDGDRISNLPEPLLLHILSFLSTKHAARTSVLSKPWKSLWTLVPDLDIDGSDIFSEDGEDICFYRMVFKIFVSRRASSIRKLRLKCCNFNCEHIDASFILSLAVERNVEELDFWFKDGSIPCDLLPPTLFHCNTLVVLKLKLVYFKGSSFHFPSLKILRLEDAEHEDEDTFRSLLSGCPVLDEFVMSYGYASVFDMSFHFEISSLTVRTVTIGRPPPSKITVNAPALEYLSIDIGAPGHVWVLNDVPGSVRANFRITGIQLKGDYQDIVKGFLGALCNVQFLELKSISGLVHDHEIPKDVFPRFDYLVELKVTGCYYNYCPLPMLLNMLLNCSRLEHLILVSTDTCVKTQCWISPRHVPNCLAFHLTTIKYERFKALEAEMEFIEYVLNKSKVLRNMTICYRPDMDSKRMSDAFLKISTFEKQSTRCQLNFQQLP